MLNYPGATPPPPRNRFFRNNCKEYSYHYRILTSTVLNALTYTTGVRKCRASIMPFTYPKTSSRNILLLLLDCLIRPSTAERTKNFALPPLLVCSLSFIIISSCRNLHCKWDTTCLCCAELNRHLFAHYAFIEPV